MGWNVIDPHQHHECQLPSFDEEARMDIGTVIECDECGAWWKREYLQVGSMVRVWSKVNKCCSS